MQQAPRVSPSFGGNFRRWALIGGGVLLLLLIFFPRPSGTPTLEITPPSICGLRKVPMVARNNAPQEIRECLHVII